VVFDFGGLPVGVAGRVVGMPDHRFAGNFRMLAQESEGGCAGSEVVFSGRRIWLTR
jgi:hypothetical protein